MADAGLLLGAARRLDGLGEESVLQLAAHLGTPAQADALFLLTEAYVDLDTHDRTRLAALRGLFTDVLSHPELVGRVASNTVEQRRLQAARLVGDDVNARERIQYAPRAYLLRVAPDDIARQVTRVRPGPVGRIGAGRGHAARDGSSRRRSTSPAATGRACSPARRRRWRRSVSTSATPSPPRGATDARWRRSSSTARAAGGHAARSGDRSGLSEPLHSAPLDAVAPRIRQRRLAVAHALHRPGPSTRTGC